MTPEVRDTRDIWGAAGSLKRLRDAAPPLVRLAHDGPRPLSFAEERLWFLSRSQPSSAVYNVPLAWRATGALDVDALEKSLNAVTRRHDILRTTFPAVDGQPVAVVSPSADVSLEIEDIRTAAGEAAEGEVMRRARMEVCRPFDLLRSLPLRAVLFRCAGGSDLLVLTVHQIAIDGGSIPLLRRELVEHYRAFTESRPVSLRELPIQYADFARWQRGFLQGEVLDAGTSYWSRVLDAGYAPLRLPGHSRVSSLVGPAVRRPWSLSEPLTAGLKKLARAAHATEFMVFVAALQATLRATTRAEDIIVFASFAGRSRHELRNVIGLFANVLPLRTDLTGIPTFSLLLQRVREEVLGAFAHQDLPLARIVEFLKPLGRDRHDSLSQVMVIYQNAPLAAPALPGLRFEPVHEIDNDVAHFSLLFDLVDTTEGLRGTVKYRSDVLTEAVIDRMLADVRILLERAVADPEIELGALPQSPVDVLAAAPIFREAPSSSDAREPAQPDDMLERRLLSLWEDVLRLKPIGIHDNFFDLGGDSFAAVRLVAGIEALLGRRLPLVTLLEAPTIAQLAALLRRDGWVPRWSSLVPIRPGGSRAPFFCFHGVGGNILEFEHLGRYLNPDQPLYGLQAQGLDGKKPRHKTVEEMAAHYIKEIRELQLRGPYYLGGSSFGGMVAYEAAQQLLADGEEVALLVVFDTHAPGFPRYLPTTTALKRRLGHLRFRIELHLSNIALSQRGERWNYVRVKAGRLGTRLRGKVKRHARAFLEGRFLPRTFREVRKAGVGANRLYVPKPYPGTLTLLRATEQPYGIYPDRSNGWSGLILKGIEIHDVPGHHGSIMREPRVRGLAAVLDACLERAQIARP